MEELVFKGENNQVLTTSLMVAQKFGKEHKHVLESIRNLLVENSAHVDNQEINNMFALTEWDIPLNSGTTVTRKSPVYVMNRDGFTLLVMGFTGKKAMKFKIDYIKAFNEMEAKIKEFQKPLSQLEILVQSAQALLEQSRRLEKVEQRLDDMEKERNENGENLLAISISTTKIPEMSLRDKIRQAVNRYASATNTSYSDVWHSVYNTLYNP